MTAQLPEVVLPETIQDLGAVDVEPFESLLAQLGEGFWQAENDRKENDFGVFHSTEHIIFRFLANADDPRSHYDRPSWAIVKQRIEPEMRRAIAVYDFGNPVFSKAMFARLKPHSTIDRHRDSAHGNRLCHKIHIPVVTHPDAWFASGPQRVHLAHGRAYEVNNVRSHAAGNDSDQARVHFIFEVFDDVLAS